MTIESITDGHFFIYLLLNIMFKLFKNRKKLKKILLRIFVYLLLNFLVIVTFWTMLTLEEWDHGCIGSDFSLYLCVIWKVSTTNILWFLIWFPINILAVPIALWTIFILLTHNFFGFWDMDLGKQFYSLGLLGIIIMALIYWIYIWLRKFFKKKK